MKKVLFFFVVVFSVAINSSGNAQSDDQNDSRRHPVIQNVSGVDPVERVIYFSENRGFVVGRNGIAVTSNGGNTWSHSLGYSNMVLYDAAKKDAQTAYAVGTTVNAPLSRYVIRTTNAGTTWDSISVPGSSPLYAISIKNSIIEILGSGNELIVSTDNGNNWQQYYANNGWNFVPCEVARKGNRLFVALGNLYKSDNRVDWVRDTSLSNIEIQTLANNGRNLFAAGFNMDNLKATICFSTNNGNSWRKILLPGAGYISDIEFKDQFVGYACGVWRSDTSSQQFKGVIYKTVNGGRSWFKFYQTQSQEFGIRDIAIIGHRVVFSLLNTLWVFRNYQFDEQGSEKPNDQIKLEQNFPNPFNPVTKISYSVPVSGIVSLTIFDVTGKKLQTLINEQKSSGNYEVEFDGSNLSSGTYYYKITAGEFTETKRMVLIK